MQNDFETGSRVLNQLFAAQSMLHIFPDCEKMGEFAAHALKYIPSVDLCSICLNGMEQSLGDQFDEALILTARLGNTTNMESSTTPEIPTGQNLMTFHLQTVDYSFGYVLLTLNDALDFEFYAPAVSNFINVIAVHLENIKQRDLVKTNQEQLENILHERTAELIESENKFRTLFETMMVGVVYRQADGTIISANPAAERILGQTLEQMLGHKSLRRVWQTVASDKTVLPIEMHPPMVALRTGVTIENFIQGLYYPEENKYQWLLVNAVPLFREGSNAPYQVYSTFLDITESKQTEETMLLAEQEAARLLEVADKSRRVLLSVVEDEKKARLDLKKLNEELEQRVHERTELLQISEKNYRNIFETSPVSIWKEDWSKVIHAIKKLQKEGITDFKDYFCEHPEFVQSVLDQIVILDVNEFTLTLFGAEEKEQLLQSLRLVFPIDDFQGFIGELTALSNGNHVYETDVALRTLKNEKIQVLSRMVFPDTDSDSGIVLVTLNDITLRKKAEEELERSRLKLIAANKELEAFSYSVSHDLRAPLRHINGYVNLLNDKFKEDLPEKARHYLEIVSDAAKQMGLLIDDLLQFSRTGRQELQQSGLDMNSLVQEVVEQLKPDTLNRNILWSISDLPNAYGDYSLLRQVWVNLLDNAIKYTKNNKETRIEVGFTRDQQNVIYHVKDNGVGFDMNYAHKLFGVFQRLHSQADFEGTGIGLANVHRIILKHGGRVWAESEPNKGATFFFTLPIK